MPLILLILFIGIPILELALLIEVGSLIGVWSTILLVILTAVLGTFLIRFQGMGLLFQIREKIARDEAPVEEALSSLGLLIAGLCLLTPGFFTDFIGFLCLIPPLRSAIISYGLKRAQRFNYQGQYSSSSTHRKNSKTNIIIDAKAEEINDNEASKSSKDDSPWRG